MSNTILGKNAVLLVGQTAGGKVDVSSRASGTSLIGLRDAFSVRRVPGGRGVAASEPTAFKMTDLTVNADSNSVTDPVLRDINGKRAFVTLRPEGTGSNLPEFVGGAVARTTLTFDLAQDAVTWQVMLAVDGVLAESAQ